MKAKNRPKRRKKLVKKCKGKKEQKTCKKDLQSGR